MSEMRILNSTGHTTVKWETEEQSAVAEATRIFNEHKQKGYTAFKVEPTTATKIDEFDPAAEQITMVPRIAGG